MKIETFKKIINALEEKGAECFCIHTDIKQNLGLNGTDYQSYTIGRKSVNNGKDNYFIHSELAIDGDLIIITIDRRTWGALYTDRNGPCRFFANTIYLDVGDVTYINEEAL